MIISLKTVITLSIFSKLTYCILSAGSSCSYLEDAFKVKLSDVIDELVEERGLEKSVLSSVVCEGILAAYAKKYPVLPISVDHDKKSDEVRISITKRVASTPEDDDLEISLRKARSVNPKAEIGQEISVPFDLPIGRIEILRAKQVIAQKIRSIEALAVYEEFKDKEGTVVHGVIHKCERAGAVVKLQDTLAFLPKSLMLPTDNCFVGYSIRALLKEVLTEPRNDNQLILDRASDIFLQKLFELEIPEVFERLVDIKKIARIPGYKSKVIVASNDKNIDPVGTCVGVGGARIKPILKEIGGERIDIIAWNDSKEGLIEGALKPAEIIRVEMIDSANARVYIAEDQRSVAIGKMGQNIALASKLVDVNIHLESVEKKETAADQDYDHEVEGLD